MKKNITIYLLLLAAIFFACSEDKGNYDYDPANNLKIKGISTDTAVQNYEVLKLVPDDITAPNYKNKPSRSR